MAAVTGRPGGGSPPRSAVVRRGVGLGRLQHCTLRYGRPSLLVGAPPVCPHERFCGMLALLYTAGKRKSRARRGLRAAVFARPASKICNTFLTMVQNPYKLYIEYIGRFPFMHKLFVKPGACRRAAAKAGARLIWYRTGRTGTDRLPLLLIRCIDVFLRLPPGGAGLVFALRYSRQPAGNDNSIKENHAPFPVAPQPNC